MTRFTPEQLRAKADRFDWTSAETAAMLRQAADDADRLDLIEDCWDAEVAFDESHSIFNDDFSDENYAAYEKARARLNECRSALDTALAHPRPKGDVAGFDRIIETPRRKQAVEKLLELGWTYHQENGWTAPTGEQAGEVVDDSTLWRACEAYDPIGWQVMGGDSRADFKASMRRALEAAAIADRPRTSTTEDSWAVVQPRPVGVPSFQERVSAWMGQCFLPSLYSNITERGDRLLEEVLELLQSKGYDRNRVATLVDYVYSRPIGEPSQEVGGVMVTLAGFCWIAGLDMHADGERELARINQPDVMAKIRAKQEAKNALHFDTPLPGAAPEVPRG